MNYTNKIHVFGRVLNQHINANHLAQNLAQELAIALVIFDNSMLSTIYAARNESAFVGRFRQKSCFLMESTKCCNSTSYSCCAHTIITRNILTALIFVDSKNLGILMCEWSPRLTVTCYKSLLFIPWFASHCFSILAAWTRFYCCCYQEG